MEPGYSAAQDRIRTRNRDDWWSNRDMSGRRGGSESYSGGYSWGGSSGSPTVGRGSGARRYSSDLYDWMNDPFFLWDGTGTYSPEYAIAKSQSYRMDDDETLVIEDGKIGFLTERWKDYYTKEGDLIESRFLGYGFQELVGNNHQNAKTTFFVQ